MSNPVPTFATVRELLAKPPPLHAKREVLLRLLTSGRSRARPPLRAVIVAFATLVTVTAAVGMTVVPHWFAPRRPLAPLVPAPRTTATTRSTPRSARPLAPGPILPAPAPALPAAPVLGPDLPAVPVPGPDLPVVPGPDLPAVPSGPAPSPAVSPTKAPASVVVAPPPGPSELAEQVAAFKEAENLLAASPGLAIVRLRAFEARWPQSPLNEEANIRIIQALVALGRDADARKHAARFVERYPRSPRRAELAALAAGVELKRPDE